MIQRNTHQRDSIRDCLEAAARPLSPAEILSGAQRKIPRLGMATVYRTVKELVESQWLRPVELPGEPARYELAGQAHHHHFHCRQCNRVYDVAGCPGDLRPLLPQGFELQDHEVVLYGKCERCAVAPAKKPRKRDAVKLHVHDAECDHPAGHAPLALTSTTPPNASLTTVLTATLATPPSDAAIVPGADGLGRAKGFGREFTAVARRGGETRVSTAPVPNGSKSFQSPAEQIFHREEDKNRQKGKKKAADQEPSQNPIRPCLSACLCLLRGEKSA